MLPDDSANQQHLPDGSNANPVGRLLGVGIVHSVSAAVASSPRPCACPTRRDETAAVNGAAVRISMRMNDALRGNV